MTRNKLMARALLVASVVAIAMITNYSGAREKSYDFFYKGLHKEYVLVEPVRPGVLGLLPHNVISAPTSDKLMHCTVSEMTRPVRFLDTKEESVLKSIYLYCAEGIYRVGGIEFR